MSFIDEKRVPYANLHLHSTHSDGVYSPTELVKIAKEEGYKALAITDHDVASAYDELKSACEREGMECIFGVEFTVSEPFPFHIVGFDFDPVAGHVGAAESGLAHVPDVDLFIGAEREFVFRQKFAELPHGFELKHSGHDGVVGEVSVEELLVVGQILDSDGMAVVKNFRPVQHRRTGFHRQIGLTDAERFIQCFTNIGLR